ncbi:MAG: acyl carrier protein [Clostridia bacterium]|nr:acyl carrier protein [Clostridia bacterium]
MLEKVKSLLSEQFSIDASTITEDSKLEADLGINSLELAVLAFKLEDDYGIEIDDDDIPALITVGDVVKFIESKQ